MMLRVAGVPLLLAAGVQAAARWQNVTLYHVHPSSNLHGDARDMNEGDAAGDVRCGRSLPVEVVHS
jgi:hypothetical protein